jgi:hypothetical protein
MKVYRVHHYADAGTSIGFGYFSSKQEAIADKKRHDEKFADGNMDTAEIDSLDVKLTKAGVIAVLNQWADHPDNG